MVTDWSPACLHNGEDCTEMYVQKSVSRKYADRKSDWFCFKHELLLCSVAKVKLDVEKESKAPVIVKEEMVCRDELNPCIMNDGKA